MIRVTIWNEYLHEKEEPVRHIYPNGIHGCIKEFLETDEELSIQTATFEMPEHGLTEEVLEQTDVLIFWSHMRQEQFSDEVAKRVCDHVRRGMGLIALHSAHFSKIMKGLLGTSMTLRWKHDQSERVFCTAPSVPSMGLNIFSEAVGTFILVFAIKGMANVPGLTDGLGKFIVFGIIVSIGMSLGGLTGYAINPARDLGPRFAHTVLPIQGKGGSNWGYAIVPLLGPILGALAAVALYGAIPW